MDDELGPTVDQILDEFRPMPRWNAGAVDRVLASLQRIDQAYASTPYVPRFVEQDLFDLVWFMGGTLSVLERRNPRLHEEIRTCYARIVDLLDEMGWGKDDDQLGPAIDLLVDGVTNQGVFDTQVSEAVLEFLEQFTVALSGSPLLPKFVVRDAFAMVVRLNDLVPHPRVECSFREDVGDFYVWLWNVQQRIARDAPVEW